MISRYFKVGLNPGYGIPPVINVNQDDHDETWTFTIIKEDGTVYIPSDASIVGELADGTVVTDSATVTDGNVVVIETEVMTAVPGRAKFELVLDDGSHGTANFTVKVEGRPS